MNLSLLLYIAHTTKSTLWSASHVHVQGMAVVHLTYHTNYWGKFHVHKSVDLLVTCILTYLFSLFKLRAFLITPENKVIMGCEICVVYAYALYYLNG